MDNLPPLPSDPFLDSYDTPHGVEDHYIPQRPGMATRAKDRILDAAAWTADIFHRNESLEDVPLWDDGPTDGWWDSPSDRGDRIADVIDRNNGVKERNAARQKKRVGAAALTLLLTAGAAAPSLLSGGEEGVVSGEDPSELEVEYLEPQLSLPTASSPEQQSRLTLQEEYINGLQQAQPKPVEAIFPRASMKMPSLLDASAKLSEEFSYGDCRSIDVELAAIPTIESLDTSQPIDFALEQDEYAAISEELQRADTVEVIQAIYERVFNAYNIAIVFEAESPVLKGGPGTEVSQSELADVSDVDLYRTSLETQLHSLMNIPADMMINNVINQIVVSPSHISVAPEWAAGAYSDQVIYARGDMPYPKIFEHELTHGLEEYVCKSYYNEEFKVIYDEVLAEAATMYPEFDALRSEYEQSLNDPEFTMDPERQRELSDIMAYFGAHDAYALRTEGVEMFARVGENLMVHGYIPEGANVHPLAFKVQEAVIENLQAAVPNIDVGSWLEQVTYYNARGLDKNFGTEKAKEMRVSPYDRTVSMAYRADMSLESIELYRAVELVNGDSSEFVYAERFEAAKVNSMHITLNLQGNSKDRSVIDAAREYLTDLDPTEGKHVTVDVFEDSGVAFLSLTVYDG